mmetsp:Transcript_14899/g.28452  ORF Transcript_14899/g.28452 Transcript_14899/m.28452 type:complete len:162 (+) Transcript_14899:108-593(+)|eukprot:scaffold3910_cov182-Amphora_coffeaeformis.AAC.3
MVKSTIKKREDKGSEIPVVSQATDILLGRGSGHFTHPGNAQFMQLVSSFALAYASATSKFHKTTIVVQIYKILRASGRFVRFEQASGKFYEVDGTAAKSKIGHALRYRVQKLEPMDKKRPPATRNSREASLISDEELDSVLGFPGELDLPSKIPDMELELM